MSDDIIIKHIKTKTLAIKEDGYASHFKTPNFVYGCLGGCRNTFCNVMRYNFGKVYSNTNIDEILGKVDDHVNEQDVEKLSDSIDNEFVVYDISPLTDIGVSRSLTDRPRVFDYFVNSRFAKANASIKYIHPEMLKYNAYKKVRLRIVLMPDKISSIIEPSTPVMQQRIEDAIKLWHQGFEIDFSFAPLIIRESYLKQRKELFQLIDTLIPDEMKSEVKYDSHFLNHHKWQHKRNRRNGYTKSERILRKGLDHDKRWKKIRTYKKEDKELYFAKFAELHQSTIPRNILRVHRT